MQASKRIALVAHDETKRDLLEWVQHNAEKFRGHRFWSTGTTGKLLKEHCPELDITRLKSGPRGGDQKIGSMIADGELDMLIFFIDPMSPQPHDVDVKALTRLTTLYNIPMANNRATADFLVSSPLFEQPYQPLSRDLQAYLEGLAKQR